MIKGGFLGVYLQYVKLAIVCCFNKFSSNFYNQSKNKIFTLKKDREELTGKKRKKAESQKCSSGALGGLNVKSPFAKIDHLMKASM